LVQRRTSCLNGLQPGVFVDLSPEVPFKRGIVRGDQVHTASPRGAIEARPMVTPRLHLLHLQEM
jgi:predicted molibdopterin-dependent oxidoreductase YjgC